MKIKAQELADLISSMEMVEELKGRVGDQIFKYQKQDGNFVYLKYGEGHSAKVLERESEKLKWLESQTLVVTPKVEYFVKEQDAAALIISNVAGKQSQRTKNEISKEQIVKIVAQALKDIHSIDITNPGVMSNTLDNMLAGFQELVDNNKILLDEFKQDNEGQTPQEVLQYLLEKRSMLEDNLFTHGDYCMPNVMIDENQNYGVIDWANAGVGDMYMDFSALEGSIRRNLGEEYIAQFYEAYGIPFAEVNREKIRYYQLIDQFSYHRKVD